eukprot:6144769-Prymnesium_polylepis.3
MQRHHPTIAKCKHTHRHNAHQPQHSARHGEPDSKWTVGPTRRFTLLRIEHGDTNGQRTEDADGEEAKDCRTSDQGPLLGFDAEHECKACSGAQKHAAQCGRPPPSALWARSPNEVQGEIQVCNACTTEGEARSREEHRHTECGRAHALPERSRG